MTKDLILQIKATQTAATQVRELRNELTTLIREAERIAKTSSKSTAGMDKTSQAATKQAQTIDKLTRVLEKSLKVISSLQIKNRELEKGLRGVASSAEKGAVAMNTLATSTQKASTAMKGGSDAAKRLTRVTVAGFGAMMISQAAWLAGFSLIFGPLYKFIDLIKEAIDIDNQFARSVRVLRTEGEDTGAALAKAYSAMTTEMVRTGSGAKEVSEVLYQLGSAGLSTEEAMAALSSTMDIIVGTEADITNVTKLVAGVYNNVRDSIMRAADGTIVFVGASTQLQDQLKNNVTQTEKFVAINDVLVTAFDQHQVEMSELVDGLKYSISTTNAAGMSFTELVGILATLNDHMVKAGTAGRSFQSLVARIAADSQKFATAFNIKIDASAPLDMMDILRQLHENIDSTYYSVEELGLMFQRTGLRGAKSMAILVQFYDELIKNTNELEHAAAGAAARMAQIMIDTPARSMARLNNALILITKALIAIPVWVFFELVKGINLVIAAAFALNDVLGGVPAILFEIGAAVGGILLISIALDALIIKFPILAAAVTAVTVALNAFRTRGIVVIFEALVSSCIFLIVKLWELGHVLVWVARVAIGGLYASLGPVAATLTIIAGIILGLGLALRYFTRDNTAVAKSLKQVQAEMTATEKAAAAQKNELAELWAITSQLIEGNADLHGIDFGIKDIAGATSSMQIIAEKINESMLGRTILYGEEFAWNEKILDQKNELANYAIKSLSSQELSKDAEKDLLKITNDLKKAFADRLEAFDGLIQKQVKMNELAKSFSDFATSVRYGFDIYSSIANGIGNADVAFRNFTVGMLTNTKNSVTAQVREINRLFDKMTEFGGVTLPEFQKYWTAVSKSGVDALNQIREEFTKLNEAMTKSEEKLREYASAYTELRVSAAADITAIYEAIDMGPKGALSMGKEAQTAAKEVEKLGDDLKKATEEYQKAKKAAEDSGNKLSDAAKQNADDYSAANQQTYASSEALEQARLKMVEAETELAAGILKSKNAQEQFNIAADKGTQLSMNEAAAIREHISLLQSQANILNQQGGDLSKTLAEREKYYTDEKTKLEEISKLYADMYAKELEQLKIANAAKEESDASYTDKKMALADKYAALMKGANAAVLASQEDLTKIEEQNNAATKEQFETIKNLYVELNASLASIASRVASIDFAGMADQIGKAFKIAQTDLDALNESLGNYRKTLEEMGAKETRIKIIEEVTRITRTEEQQFGGLAGFASKTFVSAGEGFVSPQYVRKNLPTLQALNAGNAVPIRGGAFPMSRFVGPSGIDNIETSLPRGSFVVSRKGMQAFERATKAISERQNYQTGGIVGGNAEPNITAASSKPEDKAMFELTLSLGNGGKRSYPLYGTHSVVKEIKDHLERENLTKL